MSRGWLGAVVLLAAAACVFNPDLSRFPPCDTLGGCPTGSTCLVQERLCLPDCGEGASCDGGSPDGGADGGGGTPDAGTVPLRVAGPATLADVPSGQPYSEQVSALGGTPPYHFQLAAGNVLPAGLVLHDNGQVDGTSTGSSTAFDVQVTDSAASPQLVTRTLQVAVTSCSLLCMRTRAVPDALTGTAYAYALQTSAGTGSVTWGVESGALPPGLQLDPASGLLSGTPTQGGTYTFTVSASDVLNKVTVPLSLQVF